MIVALVGLTFVIAGALASGAWAQTVNRCAIRPHTVCVRRNLSGAKLAGARLSYANLTGANLSRANLRGADLRYANLAGANLTGADLRGARFGVGAKLSGAVLSSANLTGQQLVAADLRRGAAIGTKLAGANLTRARLGGANLTGADLTNAVVTGADMTGANLHGTILSGVSLAHVTVGNTKSGSITRPPSTPPPGYVVEGGYLLRVLPAPQFVVAAGAGALTVTPFVPVPGASGYVAQLCDAAAANCESPRAVGPAGYTFTGLTGGRVYTVTLGAQGDGVTVADSATASQGGTPTAIGLSAPAFSLTPGPAMLTLNAFAAVSNATGYAARLCTAAGADCAAPIAVTNAGTTFSGLAGGSTYLVKLVAIGDGTVYADSAATSHAGTPTAVGLPAPVLTLTSAAGALTLNAFAAVPNAAGYLSQLCDASATVCAAPAPVTTSGRTFIGLGGGTTYTVRLTAVGDGVAFADSAPSIRTGIPAAVRLAVPAFTLTPGVGSLVLNAFAAVPNATGYSAQLCNGVGANCASPIIVTAAGTTFPGLTGGATVTVKLTATGDGVAFANSSAATQVGMPGAVSLAAPAVALTPGAGTLRLDAFAPVPNAAGYIAQVCDQAGTNCAAAITVTTAGTTFTGLSGGVAYRVAVTATGDGAAYANSLAATQTGTPASVPLSAPTFTVTAGPGTLTLNGFAAVPGASGYSASLCDATGAGCAAGTTVTIAGTVFSGLSGGTTYLVKLVATGDGAGFSDSIAAIESGTPAPVRLAAPAFSASSGVSSIVLNGFAAVPNAAGYSAQLCNAAGTGCGTPQAVTVTGRTFSGLTGGTTYTLKLTAVGDGIAYTDSPSATQAATAASFALATPVFTLSPGAGTLTLNGFVAVPNASGYTAQVCDSGGTTCAGAVAITTAGTTFPGLVGGTGYLVKLVAVGDGVAYANSSAATRTATPTAVALAAPGVAVIPGPGALTLAPFAAVPGASGYSAQLCNAAGAGCQGAVTVTTSGTTFPGLVGGTTYMVKLTATGDGIAFSDSAAATRTATPTATALPAPTFTVASGAGTLTINGFAAVPNAAGYSAQLCNAAGANCGTPVTVTTSGYSFNALTGGTNYLLRLTAQGDGVAFLDSAASSRAGTPAAVTLPAPAFTVTPGAGSVSLNAFAAVAGASGYSAQLCNAVGTSCAAAIPVTTAGTTFAGLVGGTTYTVTLTATGDGVAYADSAPTARTAAPTAVVLATPSFALSPAAAAVVLNPFVAVPNATGYSAQLCNAAGTGCQGAVTVTAAGTTFPGLTGGVAYTVKLTAIGDGVAYADSTTAIHVGTAASFALSSPTFTVTPGPGTLTLSAFAAVPNATGYSARLCDAAGAGCGNAIAVTTTGTVFSGLVGGTTYTVTLTATGDGIAYADSTAVTHAAAPTAVALAAPSFALTAAAGSITVAPFSAVSHASGYAAQLCNAAGGNCQGAVTVTTSGTTFSGLAGGTTYAVNLVAAGDGLAFANSVATSHTATAGAVRLATPGIAVTSGPGTLVLGAFEAVPGASGYSAQLCNALGAGCAPAIPVTTAGTTFPGLTGGIGYMVMLTATGDGMAFSDSAAATQTGTPAGVRLTTPALALSAGPGALTITAFAVVPNASGYSAQLCNAAGANCGTPVTVTTGGYTFTALTGGTDYLVRLTAQGDGSAYLDSPTVTHTGTPAATVLAAPTLSLTPGPGTLAIAPFAAVPNASGYAARLCNAAGAGCAGAVAVTTSGTTFSNLAGGTSYTVTLTATGDGLASADSPTATQVGMPTAVPLPAPVFGVTAGAGHLTVNSFAAVPNATGYSAQICSAVGTNCQPAVAITTAGTTFAGLTGGVTYIVTLSAVGDGTAFATSATATQSATATSYALASPAFTVTPGPGSLTLNAFAAVPHATGYAVRLCNAAGVNCGSATPVGASGMTFSGLPGGTTYTVMLTATGDGVTYADSPASSQAGSPSAVPLATPSFTVNPGAGALTVNPFTAVPNASGYAAQLCDSAAANCQTAVSVTNSGYVFTGLAGGTTYTIKLSANGDGVAYARSAAASQTGTASASRLAAPAVTLTGGPGTLTLNAFAAVPNAAGYSAQLCDGVGGNCRSAITVPTSGTTFTGLTGGTTYTVVLIAKGDGVVYADSAPGSQTGAPAPVAMAAPAFTLSAGPGSVAVNAFSAVPNATGYAAQLCDAAGANCGTPVATTTTGYSFTGLVGGTTYAVKLTATGDGTAYATSAPSTQTSTASAVRLPSPSFTLSPGGSALVLNNFAAVPNATGYTAQLCDAAGQNCQTATAITPSGTTYSGLTGGTTYSVKLTAIGDGVMYATSSPATQVGIAGAAAPTAPTVTGGSAVWTNASSVTVSASGSTVTDVSGVAGYEYETSTDGGATWSAPAPAGGVVITAEGVTLVRFRAVSGNGVESVWSPISGDVGTVRIDRTAPGLPTVAGGSGVVSTAPVTVTGSGASDPCAVSACAGVSGYQYRVSSDAGANWSGAANGGSTTISANGLSYVEFRTVDAAGNVSSWSDPSASSEADITAATASVSHVVVIVMENSDYSQIIDSTNAPYLNSLAHTYGLAANMDAVAHPSLPNYIAMTSGGTQGVIDDGNPSEYPLSVPSIFSQLGTNWKSLAESMPSNCATADSGTYAARHNPATFYTNIASQCATQDIPLGATPDISSAFTFIAPNLCDDTHDCSDQTGDTWLSNFIPQLLATPQYQSGSTAVFITWDENDSYAPGNQIPTIVISPTTHGVKSMEAFTHYSLLRTAEELLGLPLLGAAQQANSMSAAFNLP